MKGCIAVLATTGQQFTDDEVMFSGVSEGVYSSVSHYRTAVY